MISLAGPRSRKQRLPVDSCCEEDKFRFRPPHECVNNDASQHCTNFVQKSLAGFGFAAVNRSETLRKISQNFSPAGVTSPFAARAMPTHCASVVSSGRKTRRFAVTKIGRASCRERVERVVV